MKMVVIVYGEAADETMTKAFKENGFGSYTKMHGATGEGSETEPRLGTHYWPGRNNTLMMAVADEDIPRLMDLVRKLKADHPRSGLRAFTFPLEECL